MYNEVFLVDSNENKSKENPIPYLITRMGAGLLDLLMILIVFLALQTLTFYTVYDSIGYHKALTDAQLILTNSGLYVPDSSNNYLNLNEIYDNNVSLKEHFDVHITNYYLTDDRAIDASKIDEYLNNKLESGLFEIDLNGNYIEKVGISESSLQSFYEKEVIKAVNFLEQDENYIKNAQYVFIVSIFTNLITSTIAFTIFYLLVPLITKNNQTLAQKFYKIGLIDTKTSTNATKKQTSLRFLYFAIINVWIPLLIYARFFYLTFIPILISIVTILITKKNQGIHGMLTETQLISIRNTSIAPRVDISNK